MFSRLFPLAIAALAAAGIGQRGEAAIPRALSAGGHQTCVVTAAGGVKCWGASALGGGDTVTIPTGVSGLSSGVASVAVGSDHSCAVTIAGAVKCWGTNGYGQLGNGTTQSSSAPVGVSGLSSGAAAVVVGDRHSCALTTGGGVKCWGANFGGLLGDGTYTDQSTPIDVLGLGSGVAALAGGYRHTCAVTAGGAVMCWGDDGYGQLGDGAAMTFRSTPTSVSGLTSPVGTVSAGRDHTCAVTTAGGVKCWGRNTYGSLGDNTVTDRLTPTDVYGLTSGVASVSAGPYTTCAISTTGEAKCWGSNGRLQVGDGTLFDRITPRTAVGLTSRVRSVAIGEYHVCALGADGGVRCWGHNQFGQLGDGTTSNRTTPVAVPTLAGGVESITAGFAHTCVRTTSGGMKCWGDNDYGQLGDGSSMPRLGPFDVTGLAGIASVSAGSSHTCAVTGSGGLKCWGFNLFGLLGDGTTTDRSTPTAVVGLTSGVAAVSAGTSYTCALTTGGGVKCWGDNSSGQLGDGTTTGHLTPADVQGLTSGVVSVATSHGLYGDGHTCALTTGGGVKCWGDNSWGTVGDGTRTTRSTPTDVVGLTSGVTSVTFGDYHACALTTAGGVKCWGENGYGELGDGTVGVRLTPTDVVGLTSGVSAIAGGCLYTCAAMASGGVKCWGMNSAGQLGSGMISHGPNPVPIDVVGLTSRVVALAAGTTHVCALDSEGAVWCWGEDIYGALGNPTISPVHASGLGPADFDADGQADVSVYRPSGGTWFWLKSSADYKTFDYRGWGVQAQNDTPVIGDFDGDGVLDPAVYRPAFGTWLVLKSGAGHTTWESFGWGVSSDTPVPGDYDGDGVTDAAVYRPSTGTWYIKPSSGAAQWSVVFGNASDLPVAGDFDGDGRRDPAVYRPSTGTWFWLKSSADYKTFDYRGWGVDAQGDTPAPGDYDGDGRTDLCVFRPGTGTWFVLESQANYTTWSYIGWGQAGDTVVPADYDGDGKTDSAVYRAATGTWYVKPSSGASSWSIVFGATGDTPLVTIR
jgi:alpha-tubulin suppressor-like RCC1 family protein